jgi:hypothetical protein
MPNKPDYKWDEMWGELETRLMRRVDRLKFSPDQERRNAYQDVLLAMGDIEDSQER